jgi:NAD(P)-dependent dehydrogenase (short-subunit alcohol dehydrogenase family)
MAGRLEGKAALVTGGASGIGAATVRTFAREGARVMIADVQDELGEKLAGEIGESVVYQHVDVRSEDDVRKAVDRAGAELGGLDCLFANAGIVGTYGPVDELKIDEWDFTFAVNLRGVVLCMKHAARVMKPRGSGSILSTSSIAGLQGGLGPHAYAAGKSALIGLTRNIAAELAPHGIRVNCIAPGNMATEMIAGMLLQDPSRVSEIEQGLAAGSPLPGRSGVAQDIANAALYLASEEGGYVSGHTLVVDAGFTSTHASGSGGLFASSGPMFREAGQRGLPDGGGD